MTQLSLNHQLQTSELNLRQTASYTGHMSSADKHHSQTLMMQTSCNKILSKLLVIVQCVTLQYTRCILCRTAVLVPSRHITDEPLDPQFVSWHQGVVRCRL